MIRVMILGLFLAYFRRFPIQKGKARLVALLWEPLTGGEYEREVVLRQAPVRMKCDIRTMLQRRIFFFAVHEEDETNLWIRRARGASTIFDIGANVGVYSLLAAAVNRNAAVHSFEPTNDIFDRFKANISLNGFTNVTANLAAVGEHTGQAFLHACRGDDNANEGMNYVTSDLLTESDNAVPIWSLDDYCGQRGIGSIDLMKIDIEGGEYHALLGASEMLSRKAIGCIMLEDAEWAAQRSGTSTSQVKSLLLERGYHLYALVGSRLVSASGRKGGGGENVFAFAEPQR